MLMLARAAAKILPAVLAVAACSPTPSSSPSSTQTSAALPDHQNPASVEQTTESAVLPNLEAAEPVLSATPAVEPLPDDAGHASEFDAPSFVAIAAGVAHTCAVRTDGTAQCWGWNDFGQADPRS